MRSLRKFKKYKDAGLPIMVYTHNRMRFLKFVNVKKKSGKEKTEAYVYETLTEAMQDILSEGFYYSFNTLVCENSENGEERFVVGKSHAHDFEAVVKEVYYNPNVFSIDQEDRSCYSEQEYRFLMKIQSYLKAIKREDIDYDATIDEINDLALNKDAVLFKDYPTLVLPDDSLADLMIQKKRKFFVSLKTNKSRYLLANNQGIYLGLIEVVKKKSIKIDDITDKDIDIKMTGFRSLKAYKKDLKDFYKELYPEFREDTPVIINTVKVIRKF